VSASKDGRVPPAVSIIINNYNYGRYLTDAIESALGQSHSPLEVIVVDDGSTDTSRGVIEGYGRRIVPLLKANGGQASALNAGFAVARGDVVIFLDADDVLFPEAAARAAARFAPGVVKVQWPLWKVDEHLESRGQCIPVDPLPRGDHAAIVLAEGPDSVLSAPTSGNAWSRAYLERVLPIPETDYRIGADYYLYSIAPAFGRVEAIDEPLGLYRMHPKNNFLGMSFERRLEAGLAWYGHQRRVLAARARDLGVRIDGRAWRNRSHFPRLRSALQDLTRVIPAAGTIILVDESRWGVGATLRSWSVLPFPEVDGEYGGIPANDAAAVSELERLRSATGAGYFVVAWPAFWWLEHFSGLKGHLEERYVRVLGNRRLMVYALASEAERSAKRIDADPRATTS